MLVRTQQSELALTTAGDAKFRGAQQTAQEKTCPHGRVPTMMLPFEWKPGPH
jgi:hypothetical protein